MDTLSPKARSENMRRIRSKNMRPEMIVRKIVHRLGYRYRLHDSKLPSRPDIVLVRHRKVILVHGCFWHQHAKKSCLDARIPGSNRTYWVPKLIGNKIRDARNRRKLVAMGWRVLTIWECEIRDLAKLERRLKTFLSQRIKSVSN